MVVSRFITPCERRKRIEALLKRNEWSWYRLSKEMNMETSSVARSLKAAPGVKIHEPSLKTLKALARAFSVTVGFFVDVGSRRVK